MTSVPMEVPRLTARRAATVAAAIAGVLAFLTACQNTLSVSVANRCERSIETSVGSIENEEELHWKRIGPGERTRVASVDDETTRLNLLVRGADSTTPAVTVVVVDISKPALGVDDDVEVVIQGDRCPTR